MASRSRLDSQDPSSSNSAAGSDEPAASGVATSSSDRRSRPAGIWQVGFAAVAALIGCHRAAERHYRAILATDPDHFRALSGLGRLLARRRNFAEAASVWGRAAALEPQADVPAYQFARTLYRSGRIEPAAAEYLRLLRFAPTHQRGFAGLEQTIERLGRVRGGRNEAEPPARTAIWREAEALLRRRLEREPDDERLRTDLARVLSSVGSNDEALTLWSGLSEAQPAAIEPKLQIARIKQNERRPDAEAALRAVLAVNPRHGEALRRLVRLFARAGAPTDYTLQFWRDIAALDRRSSFPLVQRALIIERLRREADAEAAYREAVAAAPGDPLALLSLARFLTRHARWEEARDLFERLHRAAPKRTDALLGLGRCHERLGDLDAAEAAYRQALDLEAGNVGALLQFGRLLRRVGRVEEAIERRREVTALAPANSDAWHELVYLLASAEREDEALAELDRAEAALGASADAKIQLGRIAEAARFPDRAEAYFAAAIAAEPENAGHRAELGEYYLRQGVVDGAFHHLLDSRELDPRNVAATKQLVETVHLLRIIGIDQVALRRGPRSIGSVLVPERLFALVRDIADRGVRPYEPVPRRVIAVSASLAPGGAERQLVTLLCGLSAPEFDLDLGLLCVALGPAMRRDFFLPALRETGIGVATPEPGTAERYLRDPEAAPFAQLLRRFPEEMVAPAAFWLAEFRRRRPQVVHAWQDSTNLTAVVAALLAGVPRIVLSVRSVRPDNPRRRLKRFMGAGYRAILGHPAVVLCNNSRAGAADYADWLGIDPASIEIAYNGIDVATLERQADAARIQRVRASLSIPPGTPVVGSVFRMSEEKRPMLWVDTAAALARHLPAVHFVVCGEGPMRDDMRARAAALGIGDRFHLPGPQADIAAWYRIMDLVMLTSRHEGLPNVLLEAQGLGIPVVAPDVGGMSETVRQGVTGWTIADADAESLVERVSFCLTDSGWREQACRAAPVFVRERFGVPAMLHRHLEIYRLATADSATHRDAEPAVDAPPPRC